LTEEEVMAAKAMWDESLKKLIPLRFFTQSRPARSARLLRLHEFLEAPDHGEYLFAINVVAVTELLN
jgi:hypothetical protein